MCFAKLESCEILCICSPLLDSWWFDDFITFYILLQWILSSSFTQVHPGAFVMATRCDVTTICAEKTCGVSRLLSPGCHALDRPCHERTMASTNFDTGATVAVETLRNHIVQYWFKALEQQQAICWILDASYFQRTFAVQKGLPYHRIPAAVGEIWRYEGKVARNGPRWGAILSPRISESIPNWSEVASQHWHCQLQKRCAG